MTNLKPWPPGQSGNPQGKPKGTKHLSTYIQEMMDDPGFIIGAKDKKNIIGKPIKAILGTLINKALSGDVRAFELLAKYGYGSKVDVTSDNAALPVPILTDYASLDDNQIEELMQVRLSRIKQ